MTGSTTLAERISEVPELYQQGDESTARLLLLQTGYLDQPQGLTVADVEDVLGRNPALADRWLQRGHDQQLVGGWGIDSDRGRYRVQSYAGGHALLEPKKLHAVAEFVVRYVAFIGDVLSRHRARAVPASHMERPAQVASNPDWWPASPGYL